MRTRHRGTEMRQTALDCLIDIQNSNAYNAGDCGPLQQEQTVYCPDAAISHTSDEGCTIQFLLDHGWTETQDGNGDPTCGVDADCADGFQCVDGDCVRIDNPTDLPLGAIAIGVAILAAGWYLTQDN